MGCKIDGYRKLGHTVGIMIKNTLAGSGWNQCAMQSSCQFVWPIGGGSFERNAYDLISILCKCTYTISAFRIRRYLSECGIFLCTAFDTMATSYNRTDLWEMEKNRLGRNGTMDVWTLLLPNQFLASKTILGVRSTTKQAFEHFCRCTVFNIFEFRTSITWKYERSGSSSEFF